MLVKCPNCKIVLEVPNDLEDGCRLQCSECETHFALRRRSSSKMVYTDSMTRALRDDVSADKMPLSTLIGLVLMYGLTLLGFLGTASENLVAALSTALLTGGLTLGIQTGRPWSRIVLTALVASVWVFACTIDKIVGLVVLVLWIGPMVCVWLPQTTSWMAHKKAVRDCNLTAMKRDRVIVAVLMLLCAALFLYASGLGMSVWLNDAFKNPDRNVIECLSWSRATLAIIPLSGIFVLIMFVLSIFVDEIPFWLGLITLVLWSVGYSLGNEGIKRLKKELNS